MNPWATAAILFGALAIFALFSAPYLALKLRASRDGVQIPMLELFGMRLRLLSLDLTRLVVNAAVTAHRAGLKLPLSAIETHALAGGDPSACVQSLVEAKTRGLKASWHDVRCCDLAGRDVLAIIRAGIEPGKVVGAAEFENRFQKPR